MFRNSAKKRLTNRQVDRWLYDFLALTLARLRTPGQFQKLMAVADRDMPQVLAAILKMERRFAKKAQDADTPLTPEGQGIRESIKVDLWAALLARPRRRNPGELSDADLQDGEPRAA